ncbi:uncharacterized protein LOC128383812 [Scomber japonicus]|uniref:uncharacterized protein LOC128383812 n=1 Tax=Scomber japonicus TaxID=13676 RepID=UPI002305DFF0|nr:uncharacterized protein LOC128383812 [Scomber japonicus]
MTSPIFALYVTCLLLGRTAHITALKPSSSSHFRSAYVGENVTLECFFEDNAAVMFYWYKQTLGLQPKLMSKFYKHDKNGSLQGEFKNDPHLKLETSPGKNHLKISGAENSDSATYYCISGYSYVYDFLESIIVSVKGSGLNIRAKVHQSASESIQPEGSVTLNCTVHTGTCDDGEHSVYWFKNSEESHPGLIYTHGGRNDQCVRNTSTQTHTCVYNLPMSLNLSHAGTYYCAVASCGQIVFGDRITLEPKYEEDSHVLVYILSGALVFTIILVVFLAYTIYRMLKTKSCQCTDSQVRSSAASAPNGEDYQDADNLHYAALRDSKVSRSKRQRDDTWNECVYSSVRQ